MEAVGRPQKIIGKAALFLLLLVIYFSLFSFYGSRLFEKVFLSDTVFDENTAIGPEKVAGMTDREAAKLLNEEIENWQAQAVMKLKYAEKEIPLSSSFVEFQVRQSVDEAADGQQNRLIASVSPEKLEDELNRKMPALQIKDHIDIDLLAADLGDIGDYLKSGESVLDLSLYLEENGKTAKLAEVTADGLDSASIRFIKENPAISIKGGSSVSFNSWIEPAADKISEESLNLLSSALYQLILKTNFDIMEKNQSTALPDYIDLGYEAKVKRKKEQDFIFFNRNDYDYTIEWTADNGNVYGVLKGIPFYYTYKPELKNKKTLKPKTVLHFSPNLPYGQMRIEQYGETGLMIDVFRSRYEGAKKMDSEQVAADFYPPDHQIELYSSQEPPPPPEPEETEETDEAGTESGDETANEEDSSVDDEPPSEGEENSSSDEQNQAEDEESSSAEENNTENAQ
ncbi:VanW family protein [Domibacillus indicus]|uniref:VanW family protein n=1 Tax=Domibacillus indicus TaxID=1437523 RepID=UPI0006181BA1|nr:VanW family protein [Domibacillus indicus]